MFVRVALCWPGVMLVLVALCWTGLVLVRVALCLNNYLSDMKTVFGAALTGK
jgi:hypothetical protein